MKRYTILSFLVFLSVSLPAQQAGINAFSEIKWPEGEMVINVETLFSPGSDGLRMRNSSEEFFKKNFFPIFTDSIKKDRFGPVYFDSSHTVEAKIQQQPEILYNIDEVYNNIIKVYSVYNQDMAGMRMQYKLDIHRDIGSYFIKHSVPERQRSSLIWTPSAEYSGLVIYARGQYPVHGESGKASLKPALFPSVYDEKMRKIISAETVMPDYLKQWGTAGYFSSPSDPEIEKRAGAKPLYTMARKLYGRYSTDIIISEADAEKLFYRGRNGKLIREGRVVIICDLPSEKP